jgi:hypothetical protein
MRERERDREREREMLSFCLLRVARNNDTQ